MKCPWCGSEKLKEHHFTFQYCENPPKYQTDQEISEYECEECGYFFLPEEGVT